MRTVDKSLTSALLAGAIGQKVTRADTFIREVETELSELIEGQRLMMDDRNCYFDERINQWQLKRQIITEADKRQVELNRQYRAELWDREMKEGTLPFQYRKDSR